MNKCIRNEKPVDEAFWYEDVPVEVLQQEKLGELPTKTCSALDRQVGGNHYKDFPIQPVEFCQMNKLDYCTSNIIKYVCRHASKNGVNDLEKAAHYLELLKQFEYPNV